MSVGEELRQARQQAGLSREQVSQSTKIQLAKLEALEQNAFERLPEGIYLDGIVRAYARTVDLDGDALVQRLRADVGLHPNRTPVTDPAPGVPLSPVASSDASSAYSDLDAFPPESDVVHDPLPVAARSGDDLVLRDDANMEATVRRRSPLPFALAVIALFGAFGWGGYLYESSRRSGAAQAAGELGAAGANGAPEARAAEALPPEAPVGPSEKVAQGPSASATPPEAPVAAASPQRATMPGEPSPVTRGASPAAGAPGAPAALGALGAPDAPGAPGAPNSPAPATDVSGVWTLDTRIESSSYRDYEGLQLGYHLQLQQDGSRVSGTGVKTVENGRRLGSTAQTPILIEGSISGERLTLTFIERGLRRTTDGKMILNVNDDGVLRGRFSSTAAHSVGLVEARRTQS